MRRNRRENAEAMKVVFFFHSSALLSQSSEDAGAIGRAVTMWTGRHTVGYKFVGWDSSKKFVDVAVARSQNSS